MTAQATRMLKEARPLIWPWCAVALAGALPLVYPMSWTPLMYLIGFFVVPVMATLSLGDEFQHGTLALLLSQPVGRMRIWSEKLSVTVVAIVSAVLLFSLALRATAFSPDRQELIFAAAWIVAITASATFWTLFTRSSVGGVAVNLVVQSILIIMIPWASLAERLRARGYLSPVNIIVIPSVIIAGYAGVMLWLSGRSLVRFQVTGGMAGDDLLTAGPDVMPGALADWLRCRPTGAVLNLIRKELRLLRPVWLISLLAAVGWACLTLFGLLYERGYSRNFETAVVIVGVISTLMIAILAGSLVTGGGENLRHARLEPDAAGFGSPPVGRQAVGGTVRRLRGCGTAPHADRGQTSSYAVRSEFGNTLSARGVTTNVRRLLVRVRRGRDGVRGALGRSGSSYSHWRQLFRQTVGVRPCPSYVAG